MSESFLNGKVVLHPGDSRDVLKTLADNSIDSIVTDPPYALVSIVKRFGAENSAAVRVPEGGTGAYARASKGFMGKVWDTGETAFAVEFWQECLRVLKPGGHVVSFSGTRTFHRMVCAIEDAGFEIRDQIQWIYGSGFPKSHDVSKGIDRAAGAARDIVGVAGRSGSARSCMAGDFAGGEYMETAPATDSAIQWQGWGTALKPSAEPICLARKPLSEKTVAANVLKWGTGAINIDGCRVGIDGGTAKASPVKDSKTVTAYGNGLNGGGCVDIGAGRWPANIILDGSEEVIAAFPDSDHARGNSTAKTQMRADSTVNYASSTRLEYGFAGDEGSAARFFYTAKADSDDRLGSKHPTVKPVDLMQWLCRLVTPLRVVDFVCDTCNNPPHDSKTKTSPDSPLRDLPEALQAEGQRARGKVLQPSLRVDEPATTGAAVRTVRHDLSAKEGRAAEVLLSVVCDEMGGTSEAQNSHADDPRLSSVLSSGPPDGDQAGLHDGAPLHHGSASGPQPFADRGGASHQRRKGRQPDRESTSDVEGSARPDQKTASADHNHVPPLRGENKAERRCPSCNSTLRRVEKPGTVLDPFAGTGTTGEAAFREGFNAVLIEREEEYQNDIRRRMALCMAGPEERKRESIKAKLGDVPFEPGSLFA